jgi:hypothetical protein
MAQAEGITTAIGELMSRGRPDQSTSPVRLAHTEFVAALGGKRGGVGGEICEIESHAECVAAMADSSTR